MAIDRHAMPEQDAGGARAQLRARSTSASRTCWPRRRPSAACSARTRSASTGCPVRVNIPRFIDLVARGRPRGRRGIAARRQRAALRHRPGLPAGDAVRGQVPARQEGQAGRHRRTSSGTWPTGPGSTPTSCRTPHAPSGQRVAIVGSGPAGLTAAGELVKLGPRGDHLRGLPRAGRRADLRHPGVPPAQGHRPGRGRPAEGGRREDRAQRDHRQDLHAARAARALSTPSSSRSARDCRSSWTCPARTSRASTRPTST